MHMTRISTYGLLAAAMLAAGCSTMDDDGRQADCDGQTGEPKALSFGAYLNRGTTRAGTAGELTGTVLQTGGFGVVAFYTQDMLFGQLAEPNFMYNQWVHSTDGGSSWTYEPVKYWPNETATDKLTFFAYAPYIDVNTLTGHATDGLSEGIAALTRPTHSGDPMVSYYGTLTPSECVDLCWAQPRKDQQKPTDDSKVTLDFHHALSALNVQVDAPSAMDAATTRIYVRSVTFTGLALKGVLNLNSASATDPQWYDITGSGDPGLQPVTVHDGRKDGREGIAASGNETPAGLNSDIVQSTTWNDGSTTPGVTTTARNLFDDSDSKTAPVYVIPTGEPLRVTIVYDVETKDAQLTGNWLSDGTTHGSSVENRISATVTDGSGGAVVLTAGRRYTVSLHLGVKSVEIDTTIGAWEDGGTGDADLPDTGDDADPPEGTTVGATNSVNGWTGGGTENANIGFDE